MDAATARNLATSISPHGLVGPGIAISMPTLLTSSYRSQVVSSTISGQYRNVFNRARPKKVVPKAKNAIIRCEKAAEGADHLNRRHLLLASTATTLGLHATDVKGTPFPPPDLNECDKITSVDSCALWPSNCCPPKYSETPKDFTFPTDLPMRTRLPAHEVDGEYIEKYRRAVQLMKDLPSDDPRSFIQQANIHCAYCEGAYKKPYHVNVHGNWFFLPWHRWYLYFHERILAELINDKSFALPFWNWDNYKGMAIPSMYADDTVCENGCNPLYDAHRNPHHRPPKLVDLGYVEGCYKELSDEVLIQCNYSLVRSHVKNSKSACTFCGSPYKYGKCTSSGTGNSESLHNGAHVWVGSPSEPNHEDMGNLYSAARDPIFYAHHGNVDRLWTVWKTLGENHQDYSDKDFLDTSFLFYDEKKDLVKVKVCDALDPSKLFYTYQDVPNPWSTVTLRNAGVSPYVGIEKFRGIEKFGSEVRSLIGPLKARVERVPICKRSQLDKDREEELLIEGIQFKSDQANRFDVFINFPNADTNTPIDCLQFAGSFVNVPHRHSAGYKETSFRVGITQTLRDLAATEDENIVVSIVPRGDISYPIKISNLKTYAVRNNPDCE